MEGQLAVVMIVEGAPWQRFPISASTFGGQPNLENAHVRMCLCVCMCIQLLEIINLD
jgi:hypothetical protein